MRWLQKIWFAIEEPLRFLKPLRMVVIAMVLLFWALLWSDQGQDAVRILIEVDERDTNWPWSLWFCAMVTCAALQVWYWSRQLLRIDFPQYAPRAAGADGDRQGVTSRDLAERHPILEQWTPRILGISIYLAAAEAIRRAARDANRKAGDHTSVMALTTILGLLALAVVFGFFVWGRSRFHPGAHDRVGSAATFGRLSRRILLPVVLEVVFLVWTAVAPLSAGHWFPAPSLLMISAALWAGIASFVVYWSDRYRLPFTTVALFLAVLMGRCNDNHEVRTLTVRQGGGDVTHRQAIDVTFNDWYRRLAAKYLNEPEPPVFLVATEGGGIRAAYWTAAVLTAIQDQAPQFSDHLFAISGVSGGAVGGMVFTALLADPVPGDAIHAPSREPTLASTLRSRAQRIMSYDFLAPTLASLLHADFVQRFLPGGFVPDRAKAFETAWERAYRIGSSPVSKPDDDDFLATSFLRMYSDRPAALLPSLFLNSTEVETGKRVITSNCALGDGAIPDAEDLLLSLGRDVRLSTAAHNSARFTYVSPAGSVLSAGGALRYHVVDGGYFEDSGAQTALDVIRIIRNKSVVPHIHLLLIRFVPLRPAVVPEHFVNEVLSPLRALLQTRNARGDLAVAEAKGLCSTSQDTYCHSFVLSQLSSDAMMPLGWLLAPRTRANIDLQVGPQVELPPATAPAVRKSVQENVDELREIVKLLRGKPAPDQPDKEQEDAEDLERKSAPD
jgi:hypothetical protein